MPRRHRSAVTNLLRAAPITGLAAGAVAGFPAVAHANPVPQSGDGPSPAVQQHALDVVKARILTTDAALVKTAPASAGLYSVAPGDTMSGVAARSCDGQSQDWTGIYAASRKAGLTAWNANDLSAGQKLLIECYQNPGMLGRAPLPKPPPVLTAVTVYRPAAVTPAETPAETPAGSYGDVNPGGYSGVEGCIVTRESSGQSQVMNASGHYGLFQFDEGTWESGGGSAADFGHASVAEQQAVFNSVYAQRGIEPWGPSDGC